MKKLNYNYVKRQVALLLVVSFLLTCVPHVLSYSPLPNEAPIAEIVSIDPNPAYVGEQVNFTGRGFDPENGTKIFSWDFNNDGTWEVLNAPVEGNGWVYHYANFTYSSSGNYIANLKVKDVADEYDIVSEIVEIFDIALPSVEITNPQEGQTVNDGFLVQGTADDEQGIVTQVEVKIDDSEWMVANGTNTWEYFWDVNNYEEGNHTIFARSLDDRSYYSGEISVGVLVDFMSDLTCEDSISFQNVPGGSMVIGYFTVENIGHNKSLLTWEVTEYPEWGSFVFEPKNWSQWVSDGKVRVEVDVTAPIEKNKLYVGGIKVVNSENPDDYGFIPIALTTPRVRSVNNPILHQFYCKIIAHFPFLAKLLGI